MRFCVVGGAARSGQTRLGLKPCLPPGAHFGLFSQFAWLSSQPGEAKMLGMQIWILKNLWAEPRAGETGEQGAIGIETPDTIVKWKYKRSSEVCDCIACTSNGTWIVQYIYLLTFHFLRVTLGWFWRRSLLKKENTTFFWVKIIWVRCRWFFTSLSPKLPKHSLQGKRERFHKKDTLKWGICCRKYPVEDTVIRDA
jgi:hypothetical protein